MDLIKNKIYLGNCCGNSFVIVDCREEQLTRTSKIEFSIKNIVKYNVDSALFLNNANGYDVFIEIFEKDGSESESCGNGIILVSNFLEIKEGKVKLKNTEVTIQSESDKQALLLNIKFLHTESVPGETQTLFIKAGEPHVVNLVENLSKIDIIKLGERFQGKYSGSVNVDAIQKVDETHYLISTYERGIFDHTKSCGTGSLSSFVAICHLSDKIYEQPVEFKSEGGSHWVYKVEDAVKLETYKEYCKIDPLDIKNGI